MMIQLIKETVREATKPEFVVTGTAHRKVETNKYVTFVVPEKKYEFNTRLVRIEGKTIEYKLYTIPIFNLERNKRDAHSPYRLEKINFRDGQSRIVIKCSSNVETEEQQIKRINWIKNKYKSLTEKERLKIITRYE